MKKTLFLASLLIFTGVISASGQDASDAGVKESITLSSDKVDSETFTETWAGSGMFYSDKNKLAFLAAGSSENPYYISSADDTHANVDGISLSQSRGHTVSVGTFTGDSCIIIGTEANPQRVYTENSLFIGGYGWHATSGWRTNAVLESTTRGEVPFTAHEGTIVINKGSVLDTGTGTDSLGGAQIYIGHGGKGTVVVDGGTMTTRAFLGIATTTSEPDDNTGLLEIMNGGKVYIKAEPDKINSYYNQLLMGCSSTGKGILHISGEGSELVMESSALTPAASTGQSIHHSFVSIGKGNGGDAEVTVTDSASLTLGTEGAGQTYIYVGEGAGSTGSLNVTEKAEGHLNGVFMVGYGGEGSVNIEDAGSSLSAVDMYIGLEGGKGTASIGSGASLNVSGNLISYDTNDDGSSNSIFNSGTVNVGGEIYLTDGTTTQNYGTMTASGAIYIAEGSSFINAEGASLESTNSYIAMYAGSHTTNKGTMKGQNILVAAGAVLNNTGSLISSGGEKGIEVEQGATINNEGSLTGQISGGGTVQGTGSLGVVSIGKDTSYVVGNDTTPIFGLSAQSFTMNEQSVIVFNVDGTIAVSQGESVTWGSGKHSVIFGETVNVVDGAEIEIVFSRSMLGFETDTPFTLQLISGGSNSNYGNLDTLLANTSFSLAPEMRLLRSVSADEYEVSVTNAEYYVDSDNGLWLRGNAAVVPAPEPTTATLSLLALAALAARRRRG